MKSFLRFSVIRAALALLFPVAGAPCLRAQAAPGDLDLSFDPGSGVNGAVHAVVLQPDGKVLVGGAFTTVRGLARSGVARLHSDGSGDASFRTEASLDEWGNATWGSVHALARQPDGKVLAAHAAGLSRLNADGSIDSTFSTQVGALWEDHGVYALALQPDGKILIGGAFSEVNGTSRNGLARLHADGSLDRSFFFGAALGANALAVQPDGKIVVMGFSSIFRLEEDGSLDAGFVGDQEISGPLKMALRADGKILVAGYFQSGGYGMARLQADGSLDGSFTPDLPVYEGFPYIESLAVQPDGKALFGGPFTAVEGTARHRLARLDEDGRLDETFHPPSGTASTVLAIAVQPDGRVIASGAVNLGFPAQRISLVRLEANGSLDAGFQAGEGIDGRVSALAVQPDGKVLVAGSFTVVQGLARPGLARLNGDGSLDADFEPAIAFQATASHIRSIALHPDGRVLISGVFATRSGDGLQSATIALLNPDGSLDEEFAPDFTPFVPAAVCPPGYWHCETYVSAENAWLQPDRGILVSGSGVMIATGDAAYDYFISPFLARFRADGSLDASFLLDAALTEASVQRLLVQPDGKLLLAGSFTVGGVRRGMVRLSADGSLDETFAPGVLIGGSYLFSMALQPDGKILLGGLAGWVFWDAGLARVPVARLHADGSVDRSFQFPDAEGDTVQSLVVQPDGKMVIAGILRSLADTTPPTLARLHPDGALDAGFHGPAGTGYVMTLARQPDGRLLFGGDFVTVSGEARPHVARLHGDGPLPVLEIAPSGGQVVLSWRETPMEVQLYETAQLAQPDAWKPVPAQPAAAGGRLSVALPIDGEGRFFRLGFRPVEP